MNSNAAARLPFLQARNTAGPATAGSRSAENAKGGGGATGDGTSEFSRLLVRNQTAAALSQRTAASNGKAPLPHRPAPPALAPRTEPTTSCSPADQGGSTSNATTDVADDADSSSTVSTSLAETSERPTAARSKPVASADEGAVEAVPVDPTGAGHTDVKAVVPDAVPTAAELASLVAWGGVPVPSSATQPTSIPAPREDGEREDFANTAATATGAVPIDRQPIDVGAAPAPTADPLAVNDEPDTALASDPVVSARSPDNKAALQNDAGLALAQTVEPDAALAQLALQSAGVPPHVEREQPLDAGLKTPPAWAIGAHGAPAGVRAVDPAAPPPVSTSVSTPLTDPGFHEALGMQVSLLAREGIQKAELRLNPADMGPVSVQITMNGDQARVDFGADLAHTRQAIEAGWAELATSLQEAGFTLSGGGVSQHARDRQDPQDRVSGASATRRSADDEDVPVSSVVAARPRAGAALDLYA